MTYADLKKDIAEKAYAEIPIALSHDELQCAAEAFLEFLCLPQEIKERFHFRIDSESHRTQVGYVRRHKNLGHGDNKEYFHYHALARGRFSDLAEQDRAAMNFFSHAENIFQKAADATHAILSIMEEGMAGIHNRFFPPNDFPSLFLRFLKYDQKGIGDFLARGHYDTGYMTLALAESALGLRIGSHDQDLVEAPPRREGTALFMPAMRLREWLPELKPSWHDVVQRERHAVSDACARWAIVLFIDQGKINRESTIEAHTPKYE